MASSSTAAKIAAFGVTESDIPPRRQINPNSLKNLHPRPVRSKNTTTLAFKDALTGAFIEGGGQEWLLAWGKRNPTEFFRVAARLIPASLTADVHHHSDLADLIREARLRRTRPAVIDGTAKQVFPQQPLAAAALPHSPAAGLAAVAADAITSAAGPNASGITEADFP